MCCCGRRDDAPAASVVASQRTPQPAVSQQAPPSPHRATAPPPASAPRLAFDERELRAHIHDLYRYPPTRCLLAAIVGRDFGRLEARGGYYNDDEGPDEFGGYHYFGATCPQPGCGT